MDGLAVVQEPSSASKGKGLTDEMRELTEALEAVDSAIEALKAAIRRAGRVKVPGMDVKRNLGGKLGTLLAETGLPIPRKGRAKA